MGSAAAGTAVRAPAQAGCRVVRLFDALTARSQNTVGELCQPLDFLSWLKSSMAFTCVQGGIRCSFQLSWLTSKVSTDVTARTFSSAAAGNGQRDGDFEYALPTPSATEIACANKALALSFLALTLVSCGPAPEREVIEKPTLAKMPAPWINLRPVSRSCAKCFAGERAFAL
jgi:hypothetical protein